MRTELGLETLADRDGVVGMGWVAEGVLYAELTGNVSAALGTRYADELASYAISAATIRLFIDLRQLASYDLLARGAFIRSVIVNRGRFTSFTILTWAEGIGPAARSLAATIGGDVELLTEPALFEDQLYAAAPRAPALLAAHRSSVERSQTGSAGVTGKRILIVDDSATMRRQLRSVLEGAGFAVTEAVDGEDAAEKVAAGIDAVICDIHLPRMNGIQFIESTRTLSEHADLPIIMLTSEISPELLRRARAAGARGWIAKPFKPEQLITAMRKLTKAVPKGGS